MLALLALAVAASASVTQHVTNPKAGLTDAARVQATLAKTQDPLLRAAAKSLGSCTATAPVAAPTGPMEIPHHYIAASHGPVNPAEAVATAVYIDFERRITAGMNQYIATGSHAEAACALAQLDTWAQARTVTDYDVKAFSQSWYQAEWTLSAAGTTMSVLVQDPALDPAQTTRVKAWLHTAVLKLLSAQTEDKRDEPGNNHKYWRALAAMSIGIVTADDKLYTFAVDTYRQAIGQLDKNGALPLEMARHELAIHYQSFALQPLATIAQLASRQGLDLFGFSANGQSLLTATDFLGRAVDNPALIKPYNDDEQNTKLGASDWAALAFVAAHFPQHAFPPAITQGLSKPTAATRIGGSTTIMAAPRSQP